MAESDAEHERILEMIKIGEPEQVQRNLEFLIDTELVQDVETVASIRKYYENRDPGTGPGASRPQPGGPGRVDRRLLFDNGEKLTYAFLEEPPGELAAAVETATAEWMQHANVVFELTDDVSAALIRIQPSNRNTSVIGRHALVVPSDEPTMHLVAREDYDETELAAVIHEFGHALGMVHEHQNPRSQIAWDIDQAYRYFTQRFGYSAEWVDRNLLARSEVYPCVRDFDPSSIMMFSIPPEVTLDRADLGGATELSASDKRCVASMYPK
ncbi:M12 family metallopeptidase [Aliiroseovarius sp. 2305UL8-7]|uniref:M12 family metallopeptidase n=1 Tax=Aliiroseovarius conchicola TaxID=3121637 RepID=UPI003528FCE4